MDKTNLIESIKQIPKFVMRDVAVKVVGDKSFDKQGNVVVDGNVEKWVDKEKHKAITEMDKTKPFAFVNYKYKLIQFADVFLPLIENIPELEGNVSYYEGYSIMDIFPKDEKLLLDNDDKIGIVCINSVNKMSSVFIKFCICHNKKIISLPKSVAGYRKVHFGNNVYQNTLNYIGVVDKVRGVWKIVIDEFQKINVDVLNAENILSELKFKDRFIRKKVMKKVMSGEKINLWGLFIYIIECVEMRNYKSEIHKRKKLDLITEKLFKYAVVSKLI